MDLLKEFNAVWAAKLRSFVQGAER